MTELVMVNKICDKKNRFFNIVGWTEEEIQAKIDFFPKDKFFPVRR
jgi:hypothetical protein